VLWAWTPHATRTRLNEARRRRDATRYGEQRGGGGPSRRRDSQKAPGGGQRANGPQEAAWQRTRLNERSEQATLLAYRPWMGRTGAGVRGQGVGDGEGRAWMPWPACGPRRLVGLQGRDVIIRTLTRRMYQLTYVHYINEGLW
jgi:hypothetical protein